MSPPVNQPHPGEALSGGGLTINLHFVSDSPPDRYPQSCPIRSIQPSDHLSGRAVLPVSFGRFLLAGAPSSTGLSLYSPKDTASYTALSATAFPLPAEPVKG